MRIALTLIAIGVIASGPGGGVASADPTADRVFTAPTAWLPPANVVIGTGVIDLRAVADKRVESTIILGYGLGGLAAVDAGTDTDVRGCSEDCTGAGRPRALYLGRASFRLGARQHAWFRGMPALVLGVRTTFAASGRFEDARVTEAYVVASRELGPLRMHVGVAVLDAGFAEVEQGPKARPLAGLEWTPSQYPKTTLMGDVAWMPRLESDEAGDRIALEWVAGWGVRYQAFTWGAIDLAVRHRQAEELGDSTVMLRMTGVWDPAARGARPAVR